MKIIVPMTGQGSRFKKAGYDTYKALIEIHGKPVIQHVIEMYPGESDFIFICRNDMLETTDLKELLLRLAPGATVVGMDAHKHGPVYTMTSVFDLIEDDEPVICNYCDFAQVWDYQHFKQYVAETACDGAVICYTGFHPHLLHPHNMYATCLTDDDMNMLEITEKHDYVTDREKGYYSGGTYYFKKGSYIRQYFRELMDKDVRAVGEFFISLPYNFMVRDGLTVKVYDKVPYFCQWGTPEDMEEYMAWADIFENLRYGE